MLWVRDYTFLFFFALLILLLLISYQLFFSLRNAHGKPLVHISSPLLFVFFSHEGAEERVGHRSSTAGGRGEGSCGDCSNMLRKVDLATSEVSFLFDDDGSNDLWDCGSDRRPPFPFRARNYSTETKATHS